MATQKHTAISPQVQSAARESTDTSSPPVSCLAQSTPQSLKQSPSLVVFPTIVPPRRSSFEETGPQQVAPRTARSATANQTTTTKPKRRSESATHASAQKGTIRCTKEVRGRIVKSITVSGIDNFNVVNVEFMDGTAFTVELFPTVRLKTEYNDWTVAEGKLLKAWPLITTR